MSMSTKLKREKDIISRRVKEYQNAVTDNYAKYFQGSPTYITYFQLIPAMSTQDNDLDAVHSLTGNNSPNKYKRIEDVACYGVDLMSIETEISEAGMRASSTGEMYFLPNSIVPTTNDFFFFDTDGLRDHMFAVKDVQFDRATQNKFYRVSYGLYPENSDEILNNIEDDYQFIYSNIGGKDQTVIRKVDALSAERGKELYDALTDKFSKMFYDVEMDYFIHNMQHPSTKKMVNLWNPYVQKFIHNNGLLRKYNDTILSEFFIQDINSFEMDGIFNDAVYDNSLFRIIETQGEITEEHNYYGFAQADVKKVFALPFFCSSKTYNEIEFAGESKGFYLYAYPILEKMDKSVIEAIEAKMIYNPDDDHPNGTVLYQDDHLPPSGIIKIIDGHPVNVSITKQIVKESDDVVFRTVAEFLDDTFVLSDDFYKDINKYNFKKDLKSFIFMPIILYIIKEKIDAVVDN